MTEMMPKIIDQTSTCSWYCLDVDEHQHILAETKNQSDPFHVQRYRGRAYRMALPIVQIDHRLAEFTGNAVFIQFFFRISTEIFRQ